VGRLIKLWLLGKFLRFILPALIVLIVIIWLVSC
jgi:hypothetical protein